MFFKNKGDLKMASDVAKEVVRGETKPEKPISHFVIISFSTAKDLKCRFETEDSAKAFIKSMYLAILDGKSYCDQDKGVLVSPSDFSHAFSSWEEVEE